MDAQQLRDILALQMIPKVGPVLAKNLIAYCGSAGEVFRQKKARLERIPGIGAKIAANISGFSQFDKAEKEMRFMEKHGIQPLYYLNNDYPQRLKDIPSSPLLLFYKGTANLNHQRVLGVVGTRKATEYGKGICEALAHELAPYGAIVVSGLAYGIDYTAHKASLKVGLDTVGVLGHGLDRIYPSAHRPLAAKMVEQGGLLTEYMSGTEPDREHFPARNRIVAGMVDGLVLVETAIRGGALITAEIASSFNREVFAYPGRTNDEFSAGCNHFIKINKAYLVQCVADIAYWMGWDVEQKKPDRKQIYEGLSKDEIKAVSILKAKEKLDIDNFCIAMELPASNASMLLLELEFKGIVQSLPGKVYRLL